MHIQWSVGKKLALGFGLGLLLLLIIGSVAYRSLILLSENATLVSHTHQLLENLESLLSLLKDAETGQRGFILTRQDRYLAPYEIARSKLPEKVKEVRALIVENPNADAQRTRLDQVKEKIDEKFAELAETIAERKKDPEVVGPPDFQNAKGMKAALDIVLSDRGKKIMDEVRSIVNDMERDERNLLDQRTQVEEASVATAKWTIVVGTAIAIVFNFFTGFLISRSITQPLRQAMDLSQQIAIGNLKAEKLRIRSNDEIGRLMTTFNGMLEGLQDLTRQTARVSQNLSSASAEILASTQQQATGTREQAATIQQITATMEEVSQSGSQISARAKQVAATAEATSAASNSGLQAVQDGTRTVTAIRDQIEEVARNIVALSEKTQAIGEIIATVNDIAERSNLLALNAAIEAAGVGEQGNRFSVVANEMKNLADQAKESTVQVRTILGDIQKGINSSVILTEEAVKRADSGKQQSDVTEHTIRQMAKITLESIEAFEQIIGASNQQQIGFEQVAQGMKNISQVSTQSAAATVQLEKAMSNLNSLSVELKNAIGRYQI